jgi:hypothetical protein
VRGARSLTEAGFDEALLLVLESKRGTKDSADGKHHRDRDPLPPPPGLNILISADIARDPSLP